MTEVADRADRLALARGLLSTMESRRPPARPDPVPGADGAVLPVAGPLAGLLSAGGLRRGRTVAVAGGPGATSLLLGLLAAASAGGAWVGVVGRPQLGLVAAAEAGLRLDRLALVPDPGADLIAVTSALLDGLDVVVMSGVARAAVRAADRQRLAARARQRGAVLLPVGSWPGADTELSCVDAEWFGLGAEGAGRLRARRVEVRARGRGVDQRGRTARMLLPGPDGALAAEAAVPVTADARAGAAAVRPERFPARVAG